MPKKPKQKSRKPEPKKVAAKTVKAAAPKAKSAKTSSLAGGFVRISETHIRKVYR